MALLSLEILDRRLARVQQDHVSELSDALNGGLALFHPTRNSSISEGFDFFRTSTATAQVSYGKKLHDEILMHIEQANKPIDQVVKDEFLKILARYLNDQLYANRFNLYVEALNRHMSRYGLNIDLNLHRSDIADSLYSVGSLNFVHLASIRISDELELLSQRNPPKESNEAPKNKNNEKTSSLEQANRIIKLEPNIFGIGLNINYLIRRCMGKKE